jgi:hypothetical protein
VAPDPGFPALRRKALVAGPRGDDIHAIATPPVTEPTMSQALIQRLLSLSLAGVFTLAILGSVSELFVGGQARQATLAQHGTQPAPRA